MQTHRLQLYTIIIDKLENYLDGYDERISLADDGETDTVASARKQVLPTLEECLKDFQELVNDIKTLPMTKLIDKYGELE